MAGKKSVIETGVDKLVRLVNERKKISIKDAAKELGVSVSSIEDWADFLEQEGIISIETQLTTVYLVEKKLGKKELVEKLEEVKEQKEDFANRVESSVNALERDFDETKLIDSEFRKMKDALQDNFAKLSDKLEKLEDFRKTHRQIEMKSQELENAYSKKINELDDHLSADQKRYEEIMSSIESEVGKLQKEKDQLEQMKSSEKVLESKVGEINRMLSQIRSEIDKSNEQLSVDEERIKKSAELAKRIKDDLASTSKDISEMSSRVKSSRKDLEVMEKEFLKDIEKLGSGDLDKIGPYKESKELMNKFQMFFNQTKEIEKMISEAEAEEQDLRKEYESLIKKVKVFSALSSVPEINKDFEEMHKELAQIEVKKSILSDHMKKLRNILRSVVR